MNQVAVEKHEEITQFAIIPRVLVKLHNEELHNLYSSPGIIRMARVKKEEMGEACSTNGGEEESI
jgi:hypothetical protein